MTTTQHPQWHETDETTGSLLDLIDADWRPFAERDRMTVARAIRLDAETHDGQVHPNRVRIALAQLPVIEQPKPQRVGPVYRALCLRGELEATGWDISTDTHGRNSGRPCRVFRWLGEADPDG